MTGKRVVNGARLSKQGPKKKMLVKSRAEKMQSRLGFQGDIYTYMGHPGESASRRADVNHSKDFAVNLTSNAHESDYCDQSMYILLIGKPFCGTASPLRF